jgi:hypothetical protein
VLLMSDEKPRRGRFMTQTERDLQGLQARTARARSQPRVEEEVEDEPSDGTPKPKQDDDESLHITSPIELLKAELTETGRQIADDLGVGLETPVTLEQWIKLAERVNAVKSDERRNHLEDANRILKVMGSKPPAEELRQLRVKVNIMWALLMFALISAGGSLLAVTRWLKDSGGDEVRQKQLDEKVDDHERRLRRIEWHGIDRMDSAR